MRWVTVASEEGPRACGVVNGQYIDVNAADPEMPATCARAAATGAGMAAPGVGRSSERSRPTRSCQRDTTGTRARPAEDRLHRAELSRPCRRERRARADRAGPVQQVPVRLDRSRRPDRLARREPGGRLRGRAGGGHRPQGAAHSPAASPRACRRLCRRPRRVRPRLAAQQAGQTMDGRQDVRHVRAGRARNWSLPTRSPTPRISVSAFV